MNDTLIERHGALTASMTALKTERAEVRKDLITAGIALDDQIRSGLEADLAEARQAVRSLSTALAAATEAKSALDHRIDSGDDSVDLDDLKRADMAIRSTIGKLKPTEAALLKAEHTLKPFLADNHLALLAAATVTELVDVPVLVRKRASDVQGITEAIVLSQAEATRDYGTVSASGRVRFRELGTTGLDAEALEVALKDAGSDVQVFGDIIEFETAMWPVPRLVQPSARAVVEFAEALHRTFDATLKRGGRKATDTYAYYDARWQTVEASLDVVDGGKALGKVVAVFGVEDERPPLDQMQGFMNTALSHFDTGVHTSAGVLDKITVVEIIDAGLWNTDGEGFMSNRLYDGKFGITVELDFSYEPVEV